MTNLKNGSITKIALLISLFLGLGSVHAEVLEEIVAWVDGEIITKTDLERQEQAIMAELYRTLQGTELDQAVKEAKEGLLQQMIDRKIMLGRASRLFDLDRVGESYLEMFRQQQGIASDKELADLLAPSGITVAEFRQQLIENYAPDEILRMEVSDRVAVSDAEIATYYEENKDSYRVPAKREIQEIVLLADTEEKRAERKAEMEKIREQAMMPDANFAQLAEEFSESGTKDKGGNLGEVKAGDLAPKLNDLAFATPEGEVSEILEMPYGLHLLKIKTAEEAYVKSLEDLEPEIRRELENRQFRAKLKTFQIKMRQEAKIRVAPKYAKMYELAEAN